MPLYQLEVKRFLVEHCFQPADGWTVTVDVDSSERGIQNTEKHDRVAAAEEWLVNAGVAIGAHHELGRADLVATRRRQRFVAEVEGESTRQREQALYSGLGQLLIAMGTRRWHHILALPDSSEWRTQGGKVPARVRKKLGLAVWYVSPDGVHRE